MTSDASSFSIRDDFASASSEPLNGSIREAQQVAESISRQLRAVVVGQETLIESLVLSLLCRSHLLIEGLPGVAKSTAATALATAVGLDFRRIQFTPDLLPADIIGSEIYRTGEERFTIHRGPIFANIILADEVNRAPAKVQSALLEAMQERQVTIAGQSLPLPQPFVVVATQNPLEQDGTYALPEAQTDRFLLKVDVPYPEATDERTILDRTELGRDLVREVEPVADGRMLQAAADAVRQVTLSDALKDYLVAIVMATRGVGLDDPDLLRAIRYGASPRGTIGLALATRAAALLGGRDYGLPRDVKRIAGRVLGHRIGLSFEAEADGRSGTQVVAEILDRVPVPA